MRTLALIINYNGKPFKGFQKQPHTQLTVQSFLERAWFIFSRGKEEISITGCSRLDTGVHALRYVAHLQTHMENSLENIAASLHGIFKAHFKIPIGVESVLEMPEHFHARFDALGKHYRYELWYGNRVPAELKDRVWPLYPSWVCAPFQKEMHGEDFFQKCVESTLLPFQGKHTFNDFRSTDCNGKNTTKTIHCISVERSTFYPQWHTVHIVGDGFLKQMIRFMMGTILDVLRGHLSREQIVHALQNPKGTALGFCAPARALSLVHVYYGKQWDVYLKPRPSIPLMIK